MKIRWMESLYNDYGVYVAGVRRLVATEAQYRHCLFTKKICHVVVNGVGGARLARPRRVRGLFGKPKFWPSYGLAAGHCVKYEFEYIWLAGT